MANRRFNQFYYSLHNKPVQLDCNFVVDATNAYGITSLKGPGIQNVYMHTSTTPAAGNPNPAVGIIIVKFQDNYNRYFFGGGQCQATTTGSNITIVTGASLTVGQPYVITTVGTTTTAQWVAVGVPVGMVPAVGVPFIAAATSGLGTGAVHAVGVSGVTNFEVIGNPQLTIQSGFANVSGVSSGSYMMLQAMGATSSSVTTQIPVAPLAGTLINLNFHLSSSSILVQGE